MVQIPQQGGAQIESMDLLVERHQSSLPRGKKHFIDDRMLACMDECKISTRQAIHFISATAFALGHQVEHLVLNRTTVQKMRKEYRRRQAHNILDNFDVNDRFCTYRFIFLG